MTTKASEVLVVKIPELPEALTAPSVSYLVIHDPATNETKKINSQLLNGGLDNSAQWSSAVPYPTDFIVSFNLKLWQSLQNNNEGNAPIEGAFWTELPRSSAIIIPDWQAGVYTLEKSQVLKTISGTTGLYRLLALTPFSSSDFEAELLNGDWELIGSAAGGSGASNTLNVALSTPLLGQTNQDGLNVQINDTKANKIATPTVNRVWKSDASGQPVEASFTDAQVLNTSDIDTSDPTWLISEVRLIGAEKISSSEAELVADIQLLDKSVPPGALSILESSDGGWVGESKTITGDNSTGQLGKQGQTGWLSDRTFVECTVAIETVSGSATFNRNRAVDSLNMNDTQDALVINQLDRSKNYPSGTNTGLSTDEGWDLLTQTKALNNTTYPSKLGSWWIGGINGEGYTYHCFAISGNTAYWKRNGQAEAVQIRISIVTHPTLIGRLLAHDFAVSAYTQQAGDEVSYQGQDYYDAATRSKFYKETSTIWEKY